MASRFTSRFGRSLRDYERAKELNIRPELAKKLEEELKFARELAGKSLILRDPDFTLDQLIEQEDLFQDGLQLTEAGEWEEAEPELSPPLPADFSGQRSIGASREADPRSWRCRRRPRRKRPRSSWMVC